MPKRITIKNGDRYNQCMIIKEIEPVIYETAKYKAITRRVKCRCDCGTIFNVNINDLRTGKQQSCGCYKIATSTTQGGLSRHPIYRVWVNMLDRCYNKEHPAYHNYGGRGITVCKEWQGSNGVLPFYKHVISLPTNLGWRKGLEVDRRENNRNYEPNNIHFVTRKRNSLNRRATVYCSIPTHVSDKVYKQLYSLMRVDKTVKLNRASRNLRIKCYLQGKVWRDPRLRITLKDLWDLIGHPDLGYATATSRYVKLGYSAYESVSQPPEPLFGYK